MNKRKIIIDTDPGVDDAMAIMLLSASKKYEILALTTVAGNNNIQSVTNNARFLADLTNLGCPVYSGAAKPLKKKLITANVHGKTSLGNIPVKAKQPLTNDATKQIIRLVKKYPGEVTLLTIGPLTNIAKALQKEPGFAPLVKEIVMMGGAISVPGNKNRVAEYNFFCDPEAASIVFSSDVKKILIPLDICNVTPMYMTDFKKMTHSPHYKTILILMEGYIKAIKKFEKMKGALVYDALAAYFLLDKSAFSLESMDVRIETKGEYTRGMSVADKTTWGNKTVNVKVATDLNRERFIENYIKIMNSS